MISFISDIFHPQNKREWKSFWVGKEEAIYKFLCHSKVFPSYNNPFDRCSHRHDLHDYLPEKKYQHMKFKDLVPNAPYKLRKYLLSNKVFITEAYSREVKYEEVVKLLDDFPYGVTSVCNRHFSFTLLGGKRLPKKESFIDSLNQDERIDYLLGNSSSRSILFSMDDDSKRGERTPVDVRSVKNATVVHYRDLDLLFLELYPYRFEIRSEEDRIKRKLHDEDIELQFKTEIIDIARRKEYYRMFLYSENHANDPELQQMEYCLIHMRFLDTFISYKLKKEAEAIVSQWPAGYKWFENANSDSGSGPKYEGDDFLYACVKQKESIKQKDDIINRYKVLCAKFPNAIKEYIDAHKLSDDYMATNSILSHEEILQLGDKQLGVYEKNAKTMQFHRNWIDNQSNFSENCKKHIREQLPAWGYYRYIIPFETITYDGSIQSTNFVVWQAFPHSFCLDQTLDYSLHNYIVDNTSKLNGFKKKTRSYVNSFYDKILSFIDILHSQYGNDLAILFGTSGLKDYQSFNEFHFKYFAQQLVNRKIQYRSVYEIPAHKTGNMINVIIELISDNALMEATCKSVIEVEKARLSIEKNNLNNNHFSGIIYISLNKGLETHEMQKLIIETKKKKELQRKEEEKKKEEERLRIEEEQKREREKEQKKIVREQIRKHLLDSVKDWRTLPGGIKYNYLFNYYPTTCDFEATEEEWAHRRLIWDFKNDPNKNVSPERHKHVMKVLIRQLYFTLQKTFASNENMRYLTLVCLPASTKAKNDARYKEFSERLCKVTCMESGFDHIHIVNDGLSKNASENTTGHSIQPIVRFDDWFKDKYVLLFDDVVTKGNTMLKYKTMLEKKGATVVGGIALGKTKHERPESESYISPFNIMPPIHTAPPFPPCPPANNPDDDLPF